MHDIVSAFFWFRLQPWETGKPVHMMVNSKDQNWEVEVNVLRREKKELRGDQVIETVLVEPKTRLKEVFYDRGRVWVNFSVDARRLPVWVRFQTPFGPIIGVLRMKDLTD